MEAITKKITSLNVNAKFWAEWTMYVHKKTKSTYKVSEETQKALEKYMKDFPIGED